MMTAARPMMMPSDGEGRAPLVGRYGLCRHFERLTEVHRLTSPRAPSATIFPSKMRTMRGAVAAMRVVVRDQNQR
jgi:hypothetical protein